VKIVVVSDNHYDHDVLSFIHSSNLNADVFLHLGDFQCPKEYIDPFIPVLGNNDFDMTVPRERILTLEGKRILMVHGHRYLTYGYDKLVYYAQSKDIDIVLFGHIHRYVDEIIDGVRLLNPGSCYYNRNGDPPCYMTIEMDKDKIDVYRHELEYNN